MGGCEPCCGAGEPEAATSKDRRAIGGGRCTAEILHSCKHPDASHLDLPAMGYTAQSSETALFTHFSRSKTILISISIAVNIGLLIFSDLGLSAQAMYSTRGISAFVNASVPTVASHHAATEGGGCSGEQSLQNTSLGAIATIVSVCAVPCISNLNGPCLEGCLQSNYGFSTGCTACFSTTAQCVVSRCLFDCIGGPTQGCQSCSDVNCVEEFVACGRIRIVDSVHAMLESPPDVSANSSGSSSSSGSNISSDEGGASAITVNLPPSEGYRRLGSAGDITYIVAVERAWQGEAYFVGLAILLCSGIWPYLSNLLFAAAWFLPLSPRSRGQLLQWTNRFDRWALMDVMIVCVLIALFEINLAGVHVISEARVAICTFGIAGVQSIAQGTWLARRDAQANAVTLKASALKELATSDAAHLSCCGSTCAAPLEAMLHAACMQPVWVLTSLGSLALLLAAASTTAMYREDLPLGGVSTRTAYSLFDICGQLFQPTRGAGVDAAGVFIALLYATLGLFAAALAAVLLSLASLAKMFAPAAPAGKLLVDAANLVTPYAAHDVLVVAILSLGAEFDLIVAALVALVTGTNLADQANSPLRVHAHVDMGAWLLLGSCVLMWPSSLIAVAVGRDEASTKLAISQVKSVTASPSTVSAEAQSHA